MEKKYFWTSTFLFSLYLQFMFYIDLSNYISLVYTNFPEFSKSLVPISSLSELSIINHIVIFGCNFLISLILSIIVFGLIFIGQKIYFAIKNSK